MHPALAVPELVQEIFTHIEDRDGLDAFTTLIEKNRAFARLARTCKAFKRPAIEELWADAAVYHLVNSLIPHRLVMRRHGDPDPYGWSTTFRQTKTWIADVEPLTPRDIDVIREYSSCIRTLRFPSLFTIPIAGPVLRALASLPGGVERTFPKLRSVVVTDWLDGVILQDYLPFVTHASFLDLEFSEQGLTNAGIDFLSKFTSRHGPAVYGLDLSFASVLTKPASRELLPKLCLNILRLDHLRTLVCTDLDQPTLLHVSRLPNLVSLNFKNILDLSTTPILSFPALESLTTKLYDFSAVLFFLRKLSRFPSSIQVPSWDTTTISDSEALFSILASRRDTKLRSITQAHQGGGFQNAHEFLTLRTIQPLLVFTSLTVFEWYSPSGVLITDADLGLIAHTWPHLERLRLISKTHNYIPVATLDGVFTMAKLCPRLQSLTLPVDASKLSGIAPDDPADGLCHRRLQWLNMGTCCINAKDQAKLAFILAQGFPHLDSVGLDVQDPENIGGSRTVVGVHIGRALKYLRCAKEEGIIKSWAEDESRIREMLVRFFGQACRVDSDLTHT
ncbi:hypothetical protein CONPUDRAFT_133699 [Coniophora puteana RWD-64-598 SS2]|uniref:F-box domain-containing protein n=1 Tax=Coniophora puteana (strain RWD-64-598) TaxID=741705 RepID=A0A5M3N404_CONPW|nr:uncharacterized protein CONPUDRAFT_133699 [Coniophora puteana RWD-64-598 SS2]EIW86159.1 hypothetical protein CONPUDRAFT_133699 [Coniophora puteana RWD-64-598 SS2]